MKVLSLLFIVLAIPLSAVVPTVEFSPKLQPLFDTLISDEAPTLVGKEYNIPLQIKQVSEQSLIFSDAYIQQDKETKYQFVKWKFEPEVIAPYLEKQGAVVLVSLRVEEINKHQADMPYIAATILELSAYKENKGDSFFEYLTNLTGALAYVIIFLVLVASGLGFPLPEDIPLIASGYLAWEGHTTLLGSFLVSMVGIGLGDSILYWIGRKMGMRLLDPKRPKPMFAPKRVRRVRAYFRKYGEKIVFFARFVAGFRAVAFFMAGALKMRYRNFIFYDGLAALLSVPIWIAIGYGLGHYFGDHIEDILEVIKQFKLWFGVAIAVIVVVVVSRMIYKYRQFKKNAVLAESEAAANADILDDEESR